MLPKYKSLSKKKLSDFTTLIYGNGKIGKSTFCSKYEDVLFLATEPGLNSLDVYKVDIATWDDFLTVCKQLTSDDNKFKTIIVDTIDNAYRMCTEHILNKFKIDHEGDLPFGKGWSLINNEFYRVITKLIFLPYGIVFISHSTAKEIDTRLGKQTKVQPILPEKICKMIIGMVDLVLYFTIELFKDNDNSTTKRVIKTKPSPYYDAGDRTGLLPETIDLDYDKFVAFFKKDAVIPSTVKKNKFIKDTKII